MCIRDRLIELYDESEGREIRFDDGVEDEVDTVAGLIAYGLGRVPLPGAEVEAGGLRLTAEGARDRRGRMRVHAVVVEPVDPEPADAGAGHEQEEN